ncbi:uncharacterized protein LOC117640488 [Thrips palmi]|uniref:Uncharacterized protein LOC117640488 n=1 Tax=Thrips palmi TaxID=161013 RepID=A0A6P8Y0C0_THRPL|nr:uncharacterized protein LOC117640488 [Thrips palmi]
MPLVVFVTAWDRRGSSYVIGDTISEIIKSAKDTLKLYLDSTGFDAGAEMSIDAIFTTLISDAKAGGQKIAFFIAPEGEKNTYLSVQTTPRTPLAENTIRSENQPPATPTSRPAAERHITRYPVLPMDIVRKTLKGLKQQIDEASSFSCLSLVKARDKAAKTISAEVVRHILHCCPNDFSRSTVRFYGGVVLNSDEGIYRDVFAQFVGNEKMSDGEEWFLSKIYQGLQYKKPAEQKKKKRARDDSTEDAARSLTRCLGKNYGCTNYAPSLPSGETVESQTAKREALKALHVNQDWGQAAEIAFRDTFSTQRHDILGTRPFSALGTEFISQWPIFTNGKFLLIHSELLTGVTVTHFHNRLGDRTPDIVKYMKRFWADQEAVIKGARSKLSAQASSMLKLLREMEEACTAGRRRSHQCAAVFPLICAYMTEKFSAMVVTAPIQASEEECKSAVEVGHGNPIILLQGDGIFDSSAVCSVFLFDTVQIKANNFSEAVQIWFMAFYVFNFCYTKELQHTLEFIQR